jgi:dienelactone hydrolase
VLVFHAWKGIGDHERESARRLAETGYTAFCADIYGKGVRPATNAEAGREAGKYKGDRPLLARRAAAALALLAGDVRVDAERIGAIGYCFGGTTALELARSGAAVRATVSFHGGLGAGEEAGPGSIRGAVLALHGADDPFVSAAEVSAFEAEMRAAAIDWTLVAYGGAVHSFTDPAAGDDPSRGAAYHARSARRSWEAALSFLRETLAAR